MRNFRLDSEMYTAPRRPARQWIAAACLVVAMPLAAQQPDWFEDLELSGYAEAQTRYFTEDGAWPGQDEDWESSFAAQLEIRWYGEDQRVSLQPYLRLDSMDDERSHFDLREAYWALERDDWELTVGLNKVFWGVTESRHLVDIINQTDLVEDPDREQKLGQPMVNLTLRRDWGDLDFFLMPYFREQTFPGIEGRLRTPLPVDADAVIYESSAEEWRSDIAARWSHYFGDLDVGVSAFHGTGRDPLLLPDASGETLRPFYHQISQFSVDAQYTREAWLWKVEAIVQDGWKDTFFASVAGFEYTVYGLRESDKDLGLIVEYLYDDRSPTEAATVFDDDVFLGARLAFNDVQDTSLLAGVTVDRNTHEWFFSLEAERRLGENFLLESRVRIFDGDAQANQLILFEQDDYIELSIKRYF